MYSLEEQEHLVEVILERKERSGLSTAEVARRVGMDDNRLGRILRNDRMLTACEAVTLCAYFGISMSDLMTTEDRRITSEYAARGGNASVNLS